MPRRLVIASQKGGVGKTTVALNLSVALAERGRRTLLCDLDPQGGVGLSLAKGDEELAGLADLLMRRSPPEAAVLRTRLQGLSLLPRGRLDAADTCEFEQALFRPGTLDDALGRVEGGYECVVLDAPSGLGLVTRAALAAADFALVPFQTGSLALRSIGQVLRAIEHVRSHENPRLRLLGILPTMVEKGRAGALAILGELWSGFPAVLDNIVPLAEVYATASARGLPVGFLEGRASPEARRFALLADEVEDLMARMSGEEERDHVRPARELL